MAARRLEVRVGVRARQSGCVYDGTMRAALIVFIACAWGCGASDTRSAGTSAQQRASNTCPNAELHEFQLPAFGVADGVFADWIGEDIALVHVGPMRHGERVRVGESPRFYGAIYEVRARRWVDLPDPAIALPPGPSVDYYVRVVGSRIVLLWYALAPSLGPEAGGIVYDPHTRSWTPIPRENAPPSNAFLTGPYRQTSVGYRWFFWSIAADAPGGFVLDTTRPAWSTVSTVGMPAQPNFFFLRALPTGLVLVPSTSESRAGIFHVESNRWRSTPFVRMDADYGSLVVAHDGFAVLTWQSHGAGDRLMKAFFVDTHVIPSAPLAIGHEHPNASLVHFDDERIVYVDRRHLYHVSRGGPWQREKLPFSDPVTDGGSLREVCGRRLLLVHDHYWLLDLSTLAWRRVAWPEPVPRIGHRVLFGADRIAVLGSVSERVEQSNCPPGAPCVPPARERVEDRRAFLVPLR